MKGGDELLMSVLRNGFVAVINEVDDKYSNLSLSVAIASMIHTLCETCVLNGIGSDDLIMSVLQTHKHMETKFQNQETMQ